MVSILDKRSGKKAHVLSITMDRDARRFQGAKQQQAPPNDGNKDNSMRDDDRRQKRRSGSTGYSNSAIRFGRRSSDQQRKSSFDSTLSQTKVITVREEPPSPLQQQQQLDETPLLLDVEEKKDELATTEGRCGPAPFCATSILQHSYFEYMCCQNELIDEENSNHHLSNNSARRRRLRSLPDDPTVQESIECIFASQLEDGLPHLLMEEEDDIDHNNRTPRLVAPSVLHQSLLRNRSESSVFALSRRSLIPIKPWRRVHGSLRVLGTHDPSQVDEASIPTIERAPSCSGQCVCSRQTHPVVDPDLWPQRPLLLRPSPGSGTRVKGIRLSGSQEYLALPGVSANITWPGALREYWGKSSSTTTTSSGADDTNNHTNSSSSNNNNVASLMDVMCSQCMILPINNGNEKEGEALVTDFESDLFDGTILVRVRYTEGTTPEPYNDSMGYFAGMNRRYQVVVRGRFKKPIPLTECMTGFQLERKCGKLPPKWVVKSALKVVMFFAPQLQARLDGEQPNIMSPLGSTPQCVIVENATDVLSDIGQHLEEPRTTDTALFDHVSTAESSMQRARYRKKAFDKLFAQKSTEPLTDPDKVFTFEFLQHLINFSDFSVELGSLLGSLKLKEILDGQPLQIMATHHDQKLWAFDIWHEELLEDAKRHEKSE